MIQLMKLELAKTKLMPLAIWILLANAATISLVWMFMIAVDPQDIQILYPNYPDYAFMLGFIVTIVQLWAVLVSGILQVKLVIHEYSKQTIALQFLYPISRRKIMLSKVLLIVLFVSLAFMGSVLLSFGVSYMLNRYTEIIAEPVAYILTTRVVMETTIQAAATTAISLIPLTAGILSKSKSLTLALSTLLAVMLYLPINAPNNSNILGANYTVSFLFALVGVASAVLVIYSSERRDVL